MELWINNWSRSTFYRARCVYTIHLCLVPERASQKGIPKHPENKAAYFFNTFHGEHLSIGIGAHTLVHAEPIVFGIEIGGKYAGPIRRWLCDACMYLYRARTHPEQ